MGLCWYRTWSAYPAMISSRRTWGRVSPRLSRQLSRTHTRWSSLQRAFSSPLHDPWSPHSWWAQCTRIDAKVGAWQPISRSRLCGRCSVGIWRQSCWYCHTHQRIFLFALRMMVAYRPFSCITILPERWSSTSSNSPM